MTSSYPHHQIETKWQKIWARKKFIIWHAAQKIKNQKSKAQSYVLNMFPYPSGAGLHVGHLLGYIGSDIVARHHRMKGLNVLHPMGWDAFGLPAENYAIRHKIHPGAAVKKNIANFKKELTRMGFSYDWQREINTTDPDYYKWTQWIFLQMFKKGLAYEAEAPVNWCSFCKTILANEEVIDGHCERCDHRVEKKNIRQWLLKITVYADRLLDDLENLDWPEKVKEMQRHWIGRSAGWEIEFKLKNADWGVKVFTTRPETIDGATYLVLAPEHELVGRFLQSRLKLPNHEAVAEYVEQAKNKSERARVTAFRNKTGVELQGVKAINPWNKESMPVWVADYVLTHYGTGAIMAVPAYDERDRQFAQTFKLSIKQTSLLEPRQFRLLGEKKVKYRLRDWIFSRQRYWGEPIPIIKCDACGNVPAPEKDLPIKLPAVKRYEPTGEAESPLAAVFHWVRVKCPKCRGPAQRETDTMPQWAGSSWYYIAYALSEKFKTQSPKQFWNRKSLDGWLPVDLYIGGVEHAVLHLLYARFWHKFLYDIGVVGTGEPFQKLINQGLILGPDGQKMSKSKGNVIGPDGLIRDYGADALRLYEIFMGPFGDSKPWDARGITGTRRFLIRVWNLITADNKSRNVQETKNQKIERLLHQTIKKVTGDIENFRFNTAVSALMILVNEIEKNPPLSPSLRLSFIKLLFPFAPHLSQELWQRLGKKTLLDGEPWPVYDEHLTENEKMTLVIAVSGRARDRMTVDRDLDRELILKLAALQPRVKKWLENRPVKKTIFVPGRLINFVV